MSPEHTPTAVHKVFFVNAFADRWYKGNTAVVVNLEDYPPDAALLALAEEFGFSETAFLKPLGAARYQIRWFTPEVEVPLCGHATLASAQALFDSQEADSDLLRFDSLSGELTARRMGDLIELDFPAEPPSVTEADPVLCSLLSPIKPVEVLTARNSRNLVVVYADPQTVLEMQPDFTGLRELPGQHFFGIAVTAKGSEQDYICRYFAPWEGINEDPVTGSAQTYLAPYWAKLLHQTVLKGYQASQRGGAFTVEVLDTRVLIRGQACIYLWGEIPADWTRQT